MEDLIRRWRASERRSRERRGARRNTPAPLQLARAMLTAIALPALIAVLALVAPRATSPGSAVQGQRSAAVVRILPDFAFGAPDEPAGSTGRTRDPTTVPSAEAVRAASGFAAKREGLVSFAVIDSEGRLLGRDEDRLYSAASVVKAMVLAAELRRLAAEGVGVDEGTESLLRAMITYSDNEAADAIYARVGDAGLHDVAERAGMTGFEIAGHWGNAQITAADMARFFGDLDRMFPKGYRDQGKSLLGSVTPDQSWGIPVAAGSRWGVRFKGGWLPDHALVHQVAQLRERGGPRDVALAILTDQQSSFAAGVETVEGVASRLLAAP